MARADSLVTAARPLSRVEMRAFRFEEDRMFKRALLLMGAVCITAGSSFETAQAQWTPRGCARGLVSWEFGCYSYADCVWWVKVQMRDKRYARTFCRERIVHRVLPPLPSPRFTGPCRWPDRRCV